MSNRNFFTLVALCSVSFGALAGVKVSGLDLNIKDNNGTFSIATEGRGSELPDLKVLGKTIEVTLSKADDFVAFSRRINGANLSADSTGGKALIRAILPYEVAEDSVTLGWKGNRIEITFPRGKINKVVAPERAVSLKEITPPTMDTKVTKEVLNENYLNGLMKESAPKAVVKKDEITLTQSSAQQVQSASLGKKSSSENFSFAGYAAKFTVFLAMVLGLFYGIVQLLKKGVFSRGKLGFLNNSQMIEVLSTTYVAPKRTLMVVRAHKQIFLVASSEAGLAFLSEMTDTTGLIKEGEKQITGSNFDMNLSDANTSEALDAFRLKEDIMESSPLPPEGGLAKLAMAKDDIVKFSDELKKKAKKLRPIENRTN